MGREAYPTVEIWVDDISYSMADTLLQRVLESESVAKRNKESKYTEKHHNGTEEVDGYIKLSLTVSDDVDVFGKYNTDDGRLEITYQSDRTEDTVEFKEVIDAFEDILYPRIGGVLSEDKVYMNVTTRMV